MKNLSKSNGDAFANFGCYINAVCRFKLHLRPETMKLDFDLDPLPSNKTPVMVFSDFLQYLFECTKAYIQRDTIGKERWPSVQDNIDFILAHPNGWEIVQQAQMRNAAVRAGLVSESESRTRVHFVTEGEASLHFCINKKVPFKVSFHRNKRLLLIWSIDSQTKE